MIVICPVSQASMTQKGRKRLYFCTSTDYAKLTGGSVYNRRVAARLRDRGWRVTWLKVGTGFPKPNKKTRAKAIATIRSAAATTPVVVDSLVLGTLPDLADRPVGGLVALVHHPLALETGWSVRERRRFFLSEKAALSAAEAVVVTSTSTRDTLRQDYAVPQSKIVVARPGIDRPPPHRRQRPTGTLFLLSVGAIIPRKRHQLIVSALAEIADRHWQLTIVGDLKRSPATVKSLRRAVKRSGLERNIKIAGPVGDRALRSLYARSDIFVLVPHHEGYGMAYAEALANGLAVIGAKAGGTTDVLSNSAALIVDPATSSNLAAMLRRLLREPALRARLSQAALRRAKSLPSWQETARNVERAVMRVMRS